MSQNDKADTGRPAVPSADDLRKNILTQQMAEMDREDQIRKRQQEELSKFADDFFHKHVGDEERAIIRNVVIRAVKEGKMEALVYSFPSLLCTDQGRAINSNAPDWPETLQGKAREFYDRFETLAKPQGYRLKAMIINFPGGVPGDVGFFLNWAPQEV